MPNAVEPLASPAKFKLDTSVESDDQDDNFTTGSLESAESSDVSSEVEVVLNAEVRHQHFDESFYLIEGCQLASHRGLF